MRTRTRLSAIALLLGLAAPGLAAQGFTTSDPVVHAIWEEGTQRSQVGTLAQTLVDSIGPRLTGSPGMDASQRWLVSKYGSWGIDARNERYGTWKGWRRGHTHVDLVQPRVRTLDAMLLAWSPGTRGAVAAPVIALPASATPGSLERWRREARGKFVLASMPEMACRPTADLEEFGGESALETYQARRDSAQEAWNARIAALGIEPAQLNEWLDQAGVAGVLTTSWTGGYGARRVFGVRHAARAPFLSLSCEDYGLVARLAENGQGPVLRVDARAEDLGQVPVANTIAVIPGSELPDEYVLLSAHLDSWDASSGANDNGTGTIVMMEAMRILQEVYPNPRRTIVVGHWGGEEQGLNGSRAFAADHPEIVAGLQALFNQDNGTGAVSNVSMQGLIDAGSHFAGWLSLVPASIADRIDLRVPGSPGGGGSDYAAFICHGAPAFSLSSDSWDYFRYTWHTNLDTFDKMHLDNVRDNAVLVATLAYAASEGERVGRDRREVMALGRDGQPGSWPECRDGMRDWSGYAR